MEEGPSGFSEFIQKVRAVPSGWWVLVAGVLMIVLGWFGTTFVTNQFSPTWVVYLNLFIVLLTCGGLVLAIFGSILSLVQKRRGNNLALENDLAGPGQLPNPVEAEKKLTTQSAPAIIFRIGIIGLIANVVTFFFVPALLMLLITMLVGYFATKQVFEHTKLSETPPTFWAGARLGLISGSLATLPFILLYSGLLSLVPMGPDGRNMILLVGSFITLVSGVAIVLSTLVGGLTAAKLLRKPHTPV